jgi:hypothetical protein
MFASRAVQKPTQDQAPSRAKQMSQGQMQDLRQPENVPESSPPLHRYLGNSYVQAMTAAGGETLQAPAVSPIVHEVLRSPGQPLDPATRAFIESRFGHNFSGVRVHTDAQARESVAVVNATAYTVGQHVVLGAGQPSPATLAWRHLLAHELAHVVQQSRGGPVPGFTPSAPHERDALAAARAVEDGSPSVNIACGTGVGLARSNGLPPGGPPPVAGLTLAEIEQEIVASRNVLDELAQVGSDLVEEATGAPGPPQPHRPVRARPELTGRRVSRQHVAAELAAIAEGGGPRAAAAQGVLDQIAETQGRIADLQAERAARPLQLQYRPAPASGRKAVKKPDTPKVDTGPKPQGVKAGSGSPAQAVVSAEAQLGSAEARAGARLATKVGGAIARAGRAVLTPVIATASLGGALLPGPLEALALWVNFAGSYTQAWDIIKSENTQNGFVGGLAASLLRLSPQEVRDTLERRSPGKSVAVRILDAIGMAESAFNRALGEGYRFGNGLPREGRNALRELSGVAATDKTSDTIWAMGKALLPTVERIFEEARRNKKAREFHERMEAKASYGSRF